MVRGRARVSRVKRLRLATSPATPRRPFYSPPRRRDTPSRVFHPPLQRVEFRRDLTFARTAQAAPSQSSRERDTNRPETRRDETHVSTDAPRSRVLRRRRRRTRRRRNTAPARRARCHPSVAPSRTHERTNTNASVSQSVARVRFDSRHDSRHQIEPRRRGHDVSSGAHGVDAREKKKKKVRRVREVGRAFGASRGSMTRRHACVRACMHMHACVRASSRMSVCYRTYIGV